MERLTFLEWMLCTSASVVVMALIWALFELGDYFRRIFGNLPPEDKGDDDDNARYYDDAR